MKHLAQSAFLTLFLVTPAALAQTGTNADSTTGTTLVSRPDHSGLWGLVGLLGLSGLAGLRRQPAASSSRSGNATTRG